MNSIKSFELSPIKQKNVNIYPLTEQQKGLWFDYLLDPENNQYNTFTCYEITGILDENKFLEAIYEVMSACDTFRTRLITVDGVIYQEISNDIIDEAFQYIDLTKTTLKETEITKNARKILEKSALSPYDLKNKIPTRIIFIKVSTEKFFFGLFQHHIVSDASSAFICCKLISEYYNNTKILQENSKFGMKDYLSLVNMEPEYSPENKKDSLSYWQERCIGNSFEFNFQGTVPKSDESKLSSISFELGSDVYIKLKTFSRKSRTTSFLVLTALFGILLYRYWQQEKFVIGYPINIRPKGFQNVLGFYTTMLPMCVRIEPEHTILEFINKVTKTRSEDKNYENVTLPEIVKYALDKDARTSLANFNVIISATAFKVDLKLNKLDVENIALSGGTPQHDLGISFDFLTEELQCAVSYNLSLFDKSFIKKFINHFKKLIDEVLMSPERKISEISFLSEREKQQMLYEWNETSAPYPQQECIHELFEAQVEKTPDNIAALFEEQQLSYQELNEKSNQLACYLRRLGVRPDVLVAISLEKSLSMVISLLGILKAGGAYVPLDPNYPEDRLKFMLKDTDTKFLITQKKLIKNFSHFENHIISIDSDEIKKILIDENSRNLESTASPDHLAYTIYTSGSTGNPKGVLVNHRSVINHNIFAIKEYKLTSKDKVLQFSTPAFDIFVEEVFPTLLCGATLVLANQEKLLDVAQLIKIINEKQVSVLNFPTSFWHKIVKKGNLGKSVRLQILGGEKLDKSRYCDWVKDNLDKECINTYGPTETTIISLTYKLQAKDTKKSFQNIPIGTPISNTKAYVLDHAMQLVPIGVPGELYIGGDGLARGYLNQPELTNCKFISNPFATEEEKKYFRNLRLYRTGDLVRYLSDGKIEFIGRVDNQVKIRGFRVELGEIEIALNSCPGVLQAVVVAQENENEKKIIAYILPDEFIFSPGSAEKEPADITPLQGEKIFSLRETARRHLTLLLPDFMIPAFFIVVDKIPLTINGKVDFRLLSKIYSSLENKADNYVAPRNIIEEQLCEIWRTVLNIEKIGIYDNFFAAGGESIAAIQVVSMAAQIGISISIRDILTNPTIAGLAAVNNEQKPVEGIFINHNIVSVPFNLSPQQQLFFDLDNLNIHWWHQAIMIDLPFYVSQEMLRNAFFELIKTHDSLRLRFIKLNGKWKQFYDKISCEDVVAMIFERESSEPDILPKNDDLKSFGHMLYNTVNINKGPIMAAGLIQRDKSKNSKLIWAIHHLATDIVSWQILTNDLLLLLNQANNGQPSKLPAKTTSYLYWINKVNQYVRANLSNDKESQYWIQQDNHVNIPNFPADYKYKRENIRESHCKNIILSLNRAETAKLLVNTKAFHISAILYSAFIIAYREWSGHSKVRVYTEHHGRDNSLFPEIDTSRTVGWFVHVYPILLEAQPDILEQLCWTQDLLSQIPDYGLGYLWQKYLNNNEDQVFDYHKYEVLFYHVGGLNNKALYEVLFYHVGGLNNKALYEFLLDDFVPVFSPDSKSVALFSFITSIIDWELKIVLRYNEISHEEKNIKAFGEAFKKAIISVNLLNKS